MALLPATWPSILVLALAVGGTVAVVRARGNRAYGMGIVLLAVFGLQIAFGLFLGVPQVTRELGLIPDAFLEGAQWWAPFSHMFLHAGIGHAVGNLFILLTAGPALEREIGGDRFLVIYFVAGLAGAASHVGLALLEVVPDASIAVGASGAIFGVLTAFAMIKPREKLPVPVYIIVWVPSFAVLVAFLAFNVALIFTGGSTAWWAHFAGFIVGLLASVGLEASERAGADAVDPESLADLATTDELERILDRIRRIEGTADDDEVWTEMWLERFADAAECPRCGAGLELSGDELVCQDGDFTRRIEEREDDDPF